MSERNIGQEILDGLREIKAFKAGESQLVVRQLSEPAPVREIRRGLGLTQTDFANLMGVSVRTLQDWEQGRRQPRGPAKSLLRVAEQFPEVFLRIT